MVPMVVFYIVLSEFCIIINVLSFETFLIFRLLTPISRFLRQIPPPELGLA